MTIKGQIRYRHYGEGEYAQMERVIQSLLKENGSAAFDENPVSVFGTGVEAPPSNDERSPETYVGYRQAERFGSPEKAVRNSRRTYSRLLQSRSITGHWPVRGMSVPKRPFCSPFPARFCFGSIVGT